MVRYQAFVRAWCYGEGAVTLSIRARGVRQGGAGSGALTICGRGRKSASRWVRMGPRLDDSTSLRGAASIAIGLFSVRRAPEVTQLVGGDVHVNDEDG